MALLQGKVALITGGTRGIGRGIVERFLEEGADVAFTYVSSPEKANALARPDLSVERSRTQGAGHPERCGRLQQRPGRRGPGGERLGQAGRAGEQRRHHQGPAAHAHERGRLGCGDRHQPEERVQHDQGGDAHHAQAAQRQHHQHEQRGGGEGQRRTVQLRGQQGRHHRLHQERGPGAGHRATSAATPSHRASSRPR